MSRVSVDDRSPLIKYIGWWEENSVAHSSWDYGNQAKFTFKGTSVFVYGNIPDGDGETVRVDFSIDGGRSVSRYHTSGNRMISNVVWWESGTLSDGQHTVTMTYLSEDDMDFRLDRIEYIPSAPQISTTPLPTIPSANIAPVVTTSTRIAVVTQTSTSSHVEVVTGTSSVIPGSANLISGTSSTSTSISPPASSVPVTTLIISSDGQVITQTQYLPAASVADPSGTSTSTGDVSPGTAAQTTSGSSKSVPVGAIVGGVIGSLAFLSLYLILFIVIRRKRVRRRERLEYGFAEGKGISSTNEPAPAPQLSNGDPPSSPTMTDVSQMPAGLTSKAALLAQGRARADHGGHHAADVISDIYTGYTPSEAGHTVATEAAPAYASPGPGPDGRFRENFGSNRGSIRTWSSAVAEASHTGSESFQDQHGQPPAYR